MEETALKVATCSELVQFSMSGVMKMLDYILISAIILSEMSVHRSHRPNRLQRGVGTSKFDHTKKLSIEICTAH